MELIIIAIEFHIIVVRISITSNRNVLGEGRREDSAKRQEPRAMLTDVI